MCSEGSQATLGVHHLGGWTSLSSHSQRPDAHGSLFIVFSSCASSLKSLFQTLNQSAQLSILWQSYLFTCKNTFWPKMCVAWIPSSPLNIWQVKLAEQSVQLGPHFPGGCFLHASRLFLRIRESMKSIFQSKQMRQILTSLFILYLEATSSRGISSKRE